MDDAALKGLLDADAPPARDFAFELAVMARIEQRRFQTAMAKNMALALGMALLLLLAAPQMEGLWPGHFAGMASNLVIGLLLLTADFVRRTLQPAQD